MVRRIIKNKNTSITEFFDIEFNADTLISLKGLSNKIAYCDKYLSFIGAGYSRAVFRLNDTQVIKIATRKIGLSQNSNEKVFSERFTSITPKVYSDGENFEYIISEYAEDAKREDFINILGFNFGDISTWVRLGADIEKLNSKYPEKNETWQAINDSEKLSEIKNLLLEGVKDLEKIDSWGKVKENNEYKIVIRDYGFIPNDV